MISPDEAKTIVAGRARNWNSDFSGSRFFDDDTVGELATQLGVMDVLRSHPAEAMEHG